jgi:uncharacterized RDD family membrane protein YckC
MTQSGQPGAPPPGGQPPAPPPQAPPPPPPPPSWQSTPQQPAAPPPAGGQPSQMPAWTANLTSTTPVAGPAGYFYGDVPNRSIAFIIDYIIFFVVYFIIGAITIAIFGNNIAGIVQTQSFLSVFIQQVLAYGAAAAYFCYLWVSMRGTVGMKVLGLQIGHETDGSTINYNTAILRFAVMFGPGFVAGLVSALALSLALVASLISFLWFIVLLVTTAQSPTKQGLHDRYAHTMVVKAARSVA